ncbi:bifunctional RNase H/acid phosphatase [Phycisphaerae bacterium RAS1]|nr:bifunctional RNase H/acid phosphatase [Phycisphaerae bacterium RAS1]
MNVALIPCAASEWRAEGRLLGRTELESLPGARAQCESWIESLRPLQLARILHGPDGLSRQAAEWLAAGLRTQTRELAELEEVDIGLWAGLTEEQLESRFESAFHELKDAPLNVNPPDGEGLHDAVRRLRRTLRKRITPNAKASIGLVLRPVTLAIVRWLLSGAPTASIWESITGVNTPVTIEVKDAAPKP